MKKELFLSMLVVVALVGCGSTSDSDDDSESHNQGQACLSCHKAPAAGAEGYSFYSGATAYTSLDATSATQYASNYSLRAKLSNGQIVTFADGRGTGNFNSKNSLLLSYSFTAELLDANGNIVNSSATDSHSSSRLDCNTCHTAAGTDGAPGRISPSTTTTTATTSSIISFSATVLPILDTSCKSCHGTNGNFSITTSVTPYTGVTPFVNVTSPTSSTLLTKASGSSHGGGTILPTTSSEYITIKDWITQGALDN